MAPDFKTIADFRKDNTQAIQSVCREFVLLCRKLDLFSDAFVAIDGSKFKAVNNRDLNFTQAKLKYRLKLIDQSIEKYLLQIASADRQEAAVAKVRTERLESKIANLKKEVTRLNAIEKALVDAVGKLKKKAGGELSGLDAMEARLDNAPEMMRIRRSTVEHPFGTIKSWMGSTHFQMKTLKRVGAEMSLHVLAYNLKRVMNILGTKSLIHTMQA